MKKKADYKKFIIGAVIFFMGIYIAYYLRISTPKFITDLSGWLTMFLGACFIVEGIPEEGEKRGRKGTKVHR